MGLEAGDKSQHMRGGSTPVHQGSPPILRPLAGAMWITCSEVRAGFTRWSPQGEQLLAVI